MYMTTFNFSASKTPTKNSEIFVVRHFKMFEFYLYILSRFVK